MRRVITAALAAAASFVAATPAFADVTQVAASSIQGTLVHGTGTAQTDTTVTGNLGAGGPTIVNFNADTTGPGDLLLLQGGQGQADVTGAEITLGGPANDLYNILSGNIYLTNYAGMQSIEFGLTSGAVGTIDFVIQALEADGTFKNFTFNNVAIGNGDTFYGFLASNGEAIRNVYFSVDTPPSSISLIKQVRIDLSTAPGAVPEPATWAMMLLGFGGIGMTMRRKQRRNGALRQVA